MRIAFYAPMKAPDHPVASGDRRMARLFRDAFGAAGHEVRLASRLRTWTDGADPARARRIDRIGARIAARIVAAARGRPEAAPDLWFTYHLYHKAPDPIGPRVADALSIPYLVAEASYAAKRTEGPWADGLAASAAAIARADALVALTAADAEGLAAIAPAARIHRLAPFLDVAPYTAASAERARHRAAAFGAEPGPWLLAVGMMRAGDKERSYAVLAEALATLADRPWRLAVAGDGPRRETVLAGFDPARTTWLGAPPVEDLPSLYAAADLLVWPAINEAYGMAILEAQATGLPAVAGAVGGVPEIVTDGVTGRLVPPGDPAAFAEAVADLLDDPAGRAEMAEAAERTAATVHGFDAAVAALDRVLAPLAAERERPARPPPPARP
ncbi:MAG: glycosyltransferase [Azospirillaceae bacterium]